MIVVKGSDLHDHAKPGWRTSELWLTVGKVLLTAGVALGFFTQADADSISGPISKATVAAFAFLANAYAVGEYIKSRRSVKKVGRATSQAVTVSSK